jgi:hypothetical protein
LEHIRFIVYDWKQNRFSMWHIAVAGRSRSPQMSPQKPNIRVILINRGISSAAVLTSLVIASSHCHEPGNEQECVNQGFKEIWDAKFKKFVLGRPDKEEA